MPTPSFSNNVCNNSLVAVDYVISYAQTGILTRVCAQPPLPGFSPSLPVASTPPVPLSPRGLFPPL